MKKKLLFILFIGLVSQIFAQQEGISYQAVILGPDKKELKGIDEEGNILSDATIAIKFSIIDIEKVTVYEEVQITNPDEYGRINLFIGTEDISSFEQINWDGTSKDLKVEIDFSGAGNEFVDMSLEKLTFLPQAYHRDIMAKGTLNVEEETALKSDLVVDGQSELNGELIVTGHTTINNTSELNGQVTIFADDLNGSHEDYGAYPLRIEGGKQGIAIKLENDNSAAIQNGIGRDQNFITFMNSNGEALGRIEGSEPEQVEIALDILKAIFRGDDSFTDDHRQYRLDRKEDLQAIRRTYFTNNTYVNGVFFKIWDIVDATVVFVINGGYAFVTGATVGDADDPIADAYSLIISVIQLQLFIEGNKGQGVAFESGGADYAEWLEKKDVTEIFSAGEVVGVKGGLISKKHVNVDQYMVISANPSIIGAMPDQKNEMNYERVAFIGQVPVSVIGTVNRGDYILASGIGDGTAIAVDPELMKTSDFYRIVGIAWSSSDKSSLYNFINTAVGIKTNHMATQIDEMQSVINNLQEAMVRINPDYRPVYFDSSYINTKDSIDLSKSLDLIDRSRDRINGFINDWINSNKPKIENIFVSFSGRYVDPKIQQLVDLVTVLITEMTEVFGDLSNSPIFKLLNDIKNIRSIADFKNIDFSSVKTYLDNVNDNLRILAGND